jgi:hypothetical protein
VLALSLIAARPKNRFWLLTPGPMLDGEALRQYRKRLADLDEEIDDAEAKHDVEGHAKRSAEREAHLDESLATGVSCCYEPRTHIAWTT